MMQRKKLIEVALPLPEINDASAYDKMPGIGPHPKGIHHWWARLPLPTARAILFASVVDDPEAHPEKWPTEVEQDSERERLFDIIRNMMQKRLHENPAAYEEAHQEMLKHCGGKLPTVFDPFAGGGSIPLEANRLGFEALAGDLNPVAVLLNKCNLELAPRWLGRAPVNPEDREKIAGHEGWKGTYGLAADVRYYGKLIQQHAHKRIGHLYPQVEVTDEFAEERPDLKPFIGKDLPVIAWILARTVASPNPSARGKHVPLISTYWLSNKKGSEIWLKPIVDKAKGNYHFEVQRGVITNRAVIAMGTKDGRGGFHCLLTDAPIPFDYIRGEGQQGRLGFRMIAVVAEIPRGRTYIPASAGQINKANSASPADYPDSDLPEEALGFRIQNYGIRKHWQMFTSRQLTALVAISDLIKTIDQDVRRDAITAHLSDNEANVYASTVKTFLALAMDRWSDFNNALCRWSPSNQKVMSLLGRQAIPMIWDFSEANGLGDSVGSWSTCSEYVADCIEVIAAGSRGAGQARLNDAATGANGQTNLLVSTDPPYYDNIGYAALSDFFYVWLRRTIGTVYPDIFSTVLVPKIPELTASPGLFAGDKEKAKEHFETGFRSALTALRDKMDSRFPLTVYYAFKQDDEENSADEESVEHSGVDLTTGWETLLDALISTGFQISATWPVRASQAWRMRAMGSNALASYIVLACRPRPGDAAHTDRRSFIAELKRDLPIALRHLQQGNIAPVDFAQAAIGPGMAIYSRYGKILESSGNGMSVRTALSLINQTLTEVLSELEDEFDPDTRWAIPWFEQNGFGEGDFGEAELLSKAKVTSVASLQHAHIIHSRSGKVRLLRPEELPTNWDPTAEKRLTVWEMTHHLLRVFFHEKAGDLATAELLSKLGPNSELARDLAYQLFHLCERKKRPQEALAYNALVLGWPEIARLARDAASRTTQPRQGELYS
jgi:putative DNA methylase